MILKETVKDKIWEYEYYNNGMHHLCGADVLVRNIKILKRAKRILADIILRFEDKTERYDECEYSFECLRMT